MTAVTEPSDLENVLAGLTRLIRRRLRAGLRLPRLRGAEIELLRLVRERPGLRVSEAAKELGLAGNSVSTLVKGLVELGMLERVADPSDGRATLLHVTPEADRRLLEWQERRSVLVQKHIDRLSEQDRAALTAALPAMRALAASLHEEAESGIGVEDAAEAESGSGAVSENREGEVGI
ncbi:MarR family winged helix-turn-helix transcriptional regulator [Catenulispora pinisilvae]|uniref:MarR family winged helix-turn-helix transcriptional regulator n=1 Tax=Catenulispora pinisilvae TaxID=2705253 RepID=UPI001891CF70|nr:MarR family transcriptional regulator [Catenulispora pinisilvae]